MSQVQQQYEVYLCDIALDDNLEQGCIVKYASKGNQLIQYEYQCTKCKRWCCPQHIYTNACVYCQLEEKEVYY